ncbi:lysine transporter LysE [Pigmentiphaga sp. NML080357]|uniref:LysE family translocator n=1 Tax=Pigmentiphaga sp. NML080357 TaxID=2008675 RepID=UPI000B415A4E|nr:LysE family transporter [Pigmentiphaga sp. NML080357]OVZ56395.1 lysine transporter LysE [Pigmentiphaga sp. NML080357]
MQQFLMIAAAHFLALLSPGPDFFLIARTSLALGWRIACGACAGIALAHCAFIVAAFAGVSALRPHSAAFIALQVLGSLYLLYLGYLFIRHAGRTTLGPPDEPPRLAASAQTASLGRAAAMGLLVAILNPKNALFYASLASMLAGPGATAAWKTFYGAWMTCVVLLWDLLVAATIGNGRILKRFSRALPWLERASGAVLALVALAMLGALALE